MNDITKIKTIEEKGLEDNPEFYRSIPNNPSVGRIRGADIKNVAFIVEYIKETAVSAIPTFKFVTKFKKVPLVLGLIETSVLGQRVCRQLLPNTRDMTVEIDKVTILGPSGLGISIGDKINLRIYSLDLI